MARVRGQVAAAIAAAAGVGYPLFVYLALERFDARTLGTAGVFVLATLAVVGGRGHGRAVAVLVVRRFGVAIALAALAAWLDEPVFLLFVPTAMHVYLLATFGASLRGQPMIEQFARAVQVHFPDFLIPYCRRLTWLWCGFFALNAVLTAGLALWAPLDWWALYCGGIFYLAFGLFMGGEYVFRKAWFRYYEEGFTDRIWARVFPAERTANGRRSLRWRARALGAETGDAA